MVAERVEAFLYFKPGVNEDLNSAARQELTQRGISFQETDLNGYKLDEEWPVLPVVSSRIGFVGNFKSQEDLKEWIGIIKSQS